MIVLYRSTLLSSDAGDFLPMFQYKSFTFRSICFSFFGLYPEGNTEEIHQDENKSRKETRSICYALGLMSAGT
jgi:hypothetical protein